MKIHALQTGVVAVKSAARVTERDGRQEVEAVELSPLWLQPIPIFAYLIEHRDRLTLIDTGQVAPGTSAAGRREHTYDGATGSGSVYRWTIRYDVSAEQEIHRQLERISRRAGDVKRVILTHLHTDHASGLIHFPQAEFMVSRAEFEAAHGDPEGAEYDRRTYPPRDWPKWFEPTLIDFTDKPLGPFPSSFALPGDDMVLVPTQGHSAGQMSAILSGTDPGDPGSADLSYFFAGDAAYSQRTLLQRTMVGVAVNLEDARLTLGRVRDFVMQPGVILLPAHDPDAPARLAARKSAADAEPGQKKRINQVK